jgi:hypothetical protein
MLGQPVLREDVGQRTARGRVERGESRQLPLGPSWPSTAARAPVLDEDRRRNQGLRRTARRRHFFASEQLNIHCTPNLSTTVPK